MERERKMLHNKDGKFAVGNPGGPGRPKRQTEKAYLEVMMAECPPDEWRAIVQKAVIQARAGEPRAREWLSNYLMGKPVGEAPTLSLIASGLVLLE